MAMVFAYTQVDDTYLEQIRVGVFFLSMSWCF